MTTRSRTSTGHQRRSSSSDRPRQRVQRRASIGVPSENGPGLAAEEFYGYNDVDREVEKKQRPRSSSSDCPRRVTRRSSVGAPSEKLLTEDDDSFRKCNERDKVNEAPRHDRSSSSNQPRQRMKRRSSIGVPAEVVSAPADEEIYGYGDIDREVERNTQKNKRSDKPRRRSSIGVPCSETRLTERDEEQYGYNDVGREGKTLPKTRSSSSDKPRPRRRSSIGAPTESRPTQAAEEYYGYNDVDADMVTSRYAAQRDSSDIGVPAEHRPSQAAEEYYGYNDVAEELERPRPTRSSSSDQLHKSQSRSSRNLLRSCGQSSRSLDRPARRSSISSRQQTDVDYGYGPQEEPQSQTPSEGAPLHRRMVRRGSLGRISNRPARRSSISSCQSSDVDYGYGPQEEPQAETPCEGGPSHRRMVRRGSLGRVSNRRRLLASEESFRLKKKEPSKAPAGESPAERDIAAAKQAEEDKKQAALNCPVKKKTAYYKSLMKTSNDEEAEHPQKTTLFASDKMSSDRSFLTAATDESSDSS